MFYALDCTRNKLNASGSRMSWLLFCSVFFLNFSGDFLGGIATGRTAMGRDTYGKRYYVFFY